MAKGRGGGMGGRGKKLIKKNRVPTNVGVSVEPILTVS